MNTPFLPTIRSLPGGRGNLKPAGVYVRNSPQIESNVSNHVNTVHIQRARVQTDEVLTSVSHVLQVPHNYNWSEKSAKTDLGERKAFYLMPTNGTKILTPPTFLSFVPSGMRTVLLLGTIVGEMSGTTMAKTRTDIFLSFSHF